MIYSNNSKFIAILYFRLFNAYFEVDLQIYT